MSAWSQAVWIVNKLTANLSLSNIVSDYQKLLQDYQTLYTKPITIVRKTTQGLPGTNQQIGTICIIYEDQGE